MADLPPNRIDELRRARGLSVKELADRAGLSAPYVSQMTLGIRNISIKNMAKLAAVLQCRPEDLIGQPSVNSAEVLDVWATIPVEHRDLALDVLRTFAAHHSKPRRADG